MFYCSKHGWISEREPCLACHPKKAPPQQDVGMLQQLQRTKCSHGIEYGVICPQCVSAGRT